MMTIRPFQARDLVDIALQEAQRLEVPTADAKRLEGEYAFTMIDGRGRPLAVAGLTEQWGGRAIAWAVISRLAGPHMLALVRLFRRVIQHSPYRRVEATALCGFGPAHRMLAILGMRLEAPRMAGFTPTGQDHALYAWVRE